MSCDTYIDEVESERAKRDKASKAIQQSQDRLAQCHLMLRDKETEEVAFMLHLIVIDNIFIVIAISVAN